MPTEGRKAFAFPKFDVPTKNGLPKVTSKPDVEVLDVKGAVDVLPPLT